MNTSVPPMDAPGRRRRGGWITFPFIIGSMACLTLAAGGWISNLIVYLIEEFNIKSITAAKIFNFVNGSITMFPIIGAVIADSYLGCFSVICFSSLISLLGMLLLLLTASINHLSPPSCHNNPCQHPSHLQLGLLYLALALSSLGNAGTRFTIAPMGAFQLDREAHRGIFFNWYIFTMYATTVVSSTAIVYVQDNVSWTWGFGLCLAANLLGFLLFLSGRPFYRLARPEGSPFKSLARVLVAAYRKRRMVVSDEVEDYYHGLDQDHSSKAAIKDNPTSFFRFLNRAALRSEGDSKQDGSITHQWKVCTVKQVEDLKILIKIFPLWSTGLFLCTPLAIQLSLTILQALTMDRRLGPTFTIPAGSMPVFILISTSLTLLLIDSPLSRKLAMIRRPGLTLLQRVGVGHFLTIVSMAVSAVVESKRRKIANIRTDDVAAMSVLWLVPQLVVAGAGEAFHFPGNIALFYQEFPEALKSTSTAAVAMFIGAAFYMSNGVIDLVRKVSGWVPDDINGGRVDGLYWLCCGLGGLNFGYFIVCASMYKYRGSEESADDCNDS